ncbi:NADH-quinone oxidoreductase subunit M [Termitidicoccus mucosus]|uniref:NADH-quinone oxidoreductase subunit L n=1 Tax=Termitidicoccus mucosus TaxID=1184151 RepID=A0A178IDW1_9BACT|nr:NADH-quinone oxidoreductase subunit L [Opitutaceae bacterium TSB47]
MPFLSSIIFVPWLGALLLAFFPRGDNRLSRPVALLFSASTLVLALIACASYDSAKGGLQFVEQHAWIDALNIQYHLGLDGLSLLLVLLTGLVAPAALYATWSIGRDGRLIGILFLLLQGAALGVFLALDFFHWFIFWELSLVPAFFLIRLWGGKGAPRAAYQFVIYTMGGGVFMLLAFAALYAATGTFDFVALERMAAEGSLQAALGSLGASLPWLIFGGVLLGLAVKVPLFPFHTWLPSAYAEAPAGASMFLTGVMSKMGVYGFLRILAPLFPGQLHAAAPCLLSLALCGVVLGAFAALRQTDLKRMIAYSSVNHLSYCLLALFAICAGGGTRAFAQADVDSAYTGILLQMFNHGLSAAALFYCIGILETRTGGLRGIGDFGGLRKVAPVFALFCGVAMFSSLGLPGLNGFVGEFLIFRGVFGIVPWAASVACVGLLITALFLLTFWQRVFHGPVAGATEKVTDLTARELVVLAPAAALMLLLGVWPQLLINLFSR